MRNLLRSSTALISFVAAALICRCASAQEAEGFEGWHLEPGVGQAHLVMVARVASISRVTIVEGAKTDVALREYRFEPVRLLKGIFQRDQLSMTAADLGCTEDGASKAPPLEEGEFRLLILAQQPGMQGFGGQRSYGCVSAAPGATTFGQRVPLLSGPDDPLVAVVETLIQVADSRSRRERAKMLVDQLADIAGLPAVPLLSSLQLRADWAATDPRAYESLTRLARDAQPAIRLGALQALRDMLASRNAPDDPQQLGEAANVLREILDSEEANTMVRLAALEALGHLLVQKVDVDWPLELLIAQSTTAATYAERAAATTALARIGDRQAFAAVLDALDKLPLDELPERETAYVHAALRADHVSAEKVLLARLERSMVAQQSLAAEIPPLGRLRSKDSLPLLLAAASLPSVSNVDRWHIAVALGRLGDDQAVPVLTRWLRSDDYVKEAALLALEAIDSPAAAREARPLLKPEPQLPFKLRLARLLARHGLPDGYALATEHLSDAEHTAAATLVLAALDDPRTAKDLSAILAARPDRRWHAAALSGLAAIGDSAAMEQVLDFLADDRNPMAADAAEAAGLATDGELLLPLAKLAKSRNKEIALASLLAMRRTLSGVRSSPRGLAAVDLLAAPDLTERGLDDVQFEDGESRPPAIETPAETRAAIVDAIASLVVDAYVEAEVRHQALAVARLLGGEFYAKLLSDLADQAELEGAPLLAEVEAERRYLHGLRAKPVVDAEARIEPGK